MPYNALCLMKYLDLTLPSPQENLACDEALLEACEDGNPCEILRFWEPQNYFVVVGYSNKIQHEAHVEACQQGGIPILRRISGGGSVLQGPGCLNFSLILRTTDPPFLQTISKSNTFIMKSHKLALQPLIRTPIEIQGVTDLVLNGQKFSGNAQRRKKSFLLFHGTFLLNFDLDLVEKFLPLPSKQPAYRQNRSHRNFLTNLNLPREKIKGALKKFWKASERFAKVPSAQILELAKTRYSDPKWNFKF